jgi:hypothetical protein
MGLRAAARTLPKLVFANSEAVAAAVRSRATPRAPVVTLYNPVDLDAFTPKRSGAAVRAELKVPEDTPLVGMVAHLTPGRDTPTSCGSREPSRCRCRGSGFWCRGPIHRPRGTPVARSLWLLAESWGSPIG